MIKLKYYFFLLIQLPLAIPVVLVSTPFDNFRIECPQRHGVQRLNIRMAESQGYKRTDAVFSISCGNIQELSPWETIPESIAEMEYEDCHYTDGFDPILEKNKNVTCGRRKYLSGITRISGTKTSLMCCKLRTRDVSKCIEKEFEKPLGSAGYVEIQYEGMLINSINVKEDTYLIKFCTFMPRAVGFIYDEIATSTPRPTTTTFISTTKIETQTTMSTEPLHDPTFPTLISQNEIKSINNQNNEYISNNSFENVQFVKKENFESMKIKNKDTKSQEFGTTKIDFEETNNHPVSGNESEMKGNDFELVQFTETDQSNLNKEEQIKSILPELPHQEVLQSFDNGNFYGQHQKLELINDNSQTEKNTPHSEKIDILNDRRKISDNSEKNTFSRIETKNNLPVIDPSQRPSFNNEYKNLQTDPIVIEEEIIGNDSNELKLLKSSEKKELYSKSIENNINTLNLPKSGELPHPSPLPNISENTLQPLSTINTPSNDDKVDVLKVTVAKLHYPHRYNRKYNHSRSAFGSKIFKATKENQTNEINNVESLTTTTTRYTTTAYIPRRNRKLRIENVIENFEVSTKQPMTYETTSKKIEDVIKIDQISKTSKMNNNNDEIIQGTSKNPKHTYTNDELNQMEKNTNLMISKIDEFAQIPFDETFNPIDYHSSAESKNNHVKEPIQEAINEQYHLNGNLDKDFSTKVTYYQAPVIHKRLNKPQPALSYSGRNTKEDELDMSSNVNKGTLVDEDTDNSPFDDPISESILVSQQESKASNLRHKEELEPKGMDNGVLTKNYLTSHDIRRAPEKTYFKNFYHPRALNNIPTISSTLPPLTIFNYEHKENFMPLEPLTVIQEDTDKPKKIENIDDSLITTMINSEFLVRDNYLTGGNVQNNFNVPSTTEEPKISLTITPTTKTTTIESTTSYNANIFYKVPKIKIPRKKERYLTFCTKEDAVRDENNLVIACGGDYDVWIPPRCPQGSSCFLTNDSTYRICCPVSSG